MERTLNNTSVRKNWTATQSGWNLSFTHEAGAANETVYCNGSKEGGGTVNANLNLTNSTSGLNFNGIAHDSTLAAAIMTEMQTIVAEGAE